MSTVVTGQDEDEILKAIQSMSRSGKVDGFIVLYSRKDDPIIDYLFSEGLLYILIGKATQYTNQTLYIDNDNLLAGEDATRISLSARSSQDCLSRFRQFTDFCRRQKNRLPDGID